MASSSQSKELLQNETNKDDISKIVLGTNNNIEEEFTINKNEVYTCSLSSEGKKIAHKELNESDRVREQGVQRLQQWVKNNPNIKCRHDGNFLVRFLRMKKYKLEESEALLEKYLRIRQENSAWFRNLDALDPQLNDMINRGYFFALPERDDYGRRIFFSVAGSIDPTKDTAADMMRIMQLGFESLLEDEENQVRGFTYIFDERNVGFDIISLWTPQEVAKAFQCCEKTIPLRHKEIHFINLPSALSALFEFAKALLSHKIRNRFQVHNNELKLHEKIPTRLLPSEYGGKTPMSEMIEMYKRELLLVRNNVMLLEQMKINNTSKTNKFEKTINSINRNFRKLEID
ncbi:unnamed protein product [Meganyctiphanes norvegica]|uniref:CRAL-TRIO domain-containing protein n=1 Tax=Meganyctiphanes norvegica TaxID=48144 RepID=A0AAV2R519_MEGNR